MTPLPGYLIDLAFKIFWQLNYSRIFYLNAKNVKEKVYNEQSFRLAIIRSEVIYIVEINVYV